MKSSTTVPDINGAIAPMFAAVDEFLAIGLRPMEFRPAVIRKAMKRSAVPLADLHLSHPSGVVERRLVEIATTGYRLLDPRRREDSIQRMMLGRIHPQLADEVVRVNQAKGQAMMAIQSLEESDELDVESGLLVDRASGLRAAGRVSGLFMKDDGESRWLRSLHSEDLLVDRPIRRMILQFCNLALRRPVSLAAASAFLAVSMGSWAIFQPSRSTESTQSRQASVAMIGSDITQSSTTEQPIKTAVDTAESLRSVVSATAPKANTEMGETQPVIPHARLAAADSPAVTNGSARATSPASVAIANVAIADNEKPTIALGKKSEPELATTTGVPAIELPVAESIEIDSQVVDFETDKDESAAVATRGVTLPTTPVVHIENPAPSNVRFPLPTEAQTALATDRWRMALEPIASSDLTNRMAASRKVAMTALDDGDSSTFLVSIRGLIYDAVLAGEFKEADKAILAITERFDTDIIAVAAGVSSELLAARRLDSQTQNFITWLGNLAGRALIHGKLDEAENFALQLGQLAKDSQDFAMIESSKTFIKSLETMRRLEATAVAIESGLVDKATASEHFAAGRYWALVRRDWVKALPHLSVCSDIRLAGLASNELLLGGLPDAEELSELASGYLSLASKSKGWLADSYLLHAEEILRRDTRPLSSAGGLAFDRLRTQVNVDAASALSYAKRIEIPKSSEEFSKTQVQGIALGTLKDDQNRAVTATDSATAINSTLVGRILIAGQDVGIEVDYEAGVAITDKVIELLEQDARISLRDATIEFTGSLYIERPTAIAIELTGDNADAREQEDRQVVTINGESLKLTQADSSRLTSTYRTDLPQGMWTLRWTVANFSDGMSLRAVDGLSGSMIPLTKPPSDWESRSNSLPKRLKITIAASR